MCSPKGNDIWARGEWRELIAVIAEVVVIDHHAIVFGIGAFLAETGEKEAHVTDASPREPDGGYEGEEDRDADANDESEMRPHRERPRGD